MKKNVDRYALQGAKRQISARLPIQMLQLKVSGDI
jgi:hypothetical protein